MWAVDLTQILRTHADLEDTDRPHADTFKCKSQQRLLLRVGQSKGLESFEDYRIYEAADKEVLLLRKFRARTIGDYHAIVTLDSFVRDSFG